MSFVDLTVPEREKFIKQTDGCFIPGYTGHCPTLKFRFGKRYGANTKEIIQEFKDVSPIKFVKKYKEGKPWSDILQSATGEKPEPDPVTYTNLPRRQFILGYTGFIPGLNFEYGVPFNSAANRSVLKFTQQLADQERKRHLDRMEFVNTMPKMCCTRSRDEISRLFEENSRRFYKAKVPSIAPELPPIAGYTGHIPGVKGNEASLSQRYHSAAKTGLAMLREERNRRHHLDLAKEAVADAIAYSHTK